MLVNPQAFALATATPLQRAICRASDGAPLGNLWDDETVQKGFHGVRPPEVAPATMVVLSAIRAAKTTMSCAAAVRMSQTIDLSAVISGDEVRIPILSVDKDSAGATYAKIRDMLLSRPALKSLLVREPTADSLWLRHPSGHHIEVKVVALAKYGSTVVSRWLGGIIFDEAALMAGEDGVRNLTEARRAVEGRIVPGGQSWLIGSPWGAIGPVYDLVQEHQSNPTADVIVVRAPGPSMNPKHWTPKRCAALQKREPKAYRTNVLAEFQDTEETTFPHTLVEPAMRKEPEHLPYTEGVHYVACIDPATRGNAWTLVITGHYGFGGPGGLSPLLKVAYHSQWRGSSHVPLNPDVVLGEVAERCKEYHLDEAFSDQWAVDALRVLAERHDLTLHETTLNGKNRIEMADDLRQRLSTRCLELPPSRVMRQDLVGVKKRITTNGYTIVLPKTGDGRHADYVPPLLLMTQAIPEPPDEPDEAIEYEPSFEQPLEGWDNVTGTLLSRC